jgi:hypothetical protein
MKFGKKQDPLEAETLIFIFPQQGIKIFINRIYLTSI